MGYVAAAEEYGAAYSAGLIDHETAVTAIEHASDGGLTRLGAEDVLANWQTIRGQIADIGMAAEMGIAACEAQIRRGLGDGDPTEWGRRPHGDGPEIYHPPWGPTQVREPRKPFLAPGKTAPQLSRPAGWPHSWWYAAGLLYVLAFTAIFSGIYYAVNGQFWQPFAWGAGMGILVVEARLWWYLRQRQKGIVS